AWAYPGGGRFPSPLIPFLALPFAAVLRIFVGTDSAIALSLGAILQLHVLLLAVAAWWWVRRQHGRLGALLALALVLATGPLVLRSMWHVVEPQVAFIAWLAALLTVRDIAARRLQADPKRPLWWALP